MTQRVLLVLLFVLLPSLLDARPAVHRIAVIIGNNEGSDDRIPLRYAEQDAKSLAQTLIQLGNFPSNQVHLLLGKNQVTIRDALKAAQTQALHLLKSPRDELLFFFYFSGHAEGSVLEVGPGELQFQEVLTEIRKIPSTTRMLVLDACQSGQLLRSKGGDVIPPIQIPSEEISLPKGEIVITSGTDLEEALESSEYQGSFFTHHFISGLRGGADFNLDGKVSLTEAYTYTSQNTARAASLHNRQQHPTFEFNVSGSGEIYLTNLAGGAPLLFLSPPQAGEFLIYNKNTRALVAEVLKKEGSPQYVALPEAMVLVRKKGPDYYTEQEIASMRGGFYNFQEVDGQRIKISPARRILSYSAAGRGQGLLLREGELVKLRLLETLSTKEAHPGEKIRLESAEDVYINSQLVIAAGAPANGEILAVRQKSGIVHGELICRLGYVQALDGQWVPLNSMISRNPTGMKEVPEGNPPLSDFGSETERDFASGITAFFFLPFYPLFRGRDAVLPEGTTFEAFVARDTKIR